MRNVSTQITESKTLTDKLIDTGKAFFENFIDDDFFQNVTSDWRQFKYPVPIPETDTLPQKNLKHFYNMLYKLQQFKETELFTALFAELTHKIADSLFLSDFGFLNFIGLKAIISDLLIDINAFSFDPYLEIPQLSAISEEIANTIERIKALFNLQITFAKRQNGNKTTAFLSRITKRDRREIETVKHLLKGDTREALSITSRAEVITLMEKTINALSDLEKTLCLKKSLLTKSLSESLIQIKKGAFNEDKHEDDIKPTETKNTFSKIRLWYHQSAKQRLQENIAHKIASLKKETTCQIVTAKITVLKAAYKSLQTNNPNILDASIENPVNYGWAKKRGLFASKTMRLVQTAYNHKEYYDEQQRMTP